MVKYNTASSFAKRIAIISKLVGSGQELANRAKISRRVIGKYLAGESDPSRERLVAMAEAAGVSVAWLATGRGPMRAEDGAEEGAQGSLQRIIDYDQLAEALETVKAGVEMIQDNPGSYGSAKGPLSEQSAKDRFKTWLDGAWDGANEREQLWLEVQFEKSFPDFATWLRERKL